ncbi:DEAD/DEAH box helicase [Terriglobus sp. 2YAB30_2]|uniref:DEAD/DEAH box helicase n=1 Tax=unclassified Terriglobus TaxID=2628988 RepID=UPI003F9ACC29
MNLPDLQNWMVEEGLRIELDALTRQTVRAELDNLAIESADGQVGATPDWSRLLFAGSILARSRERSQQEAALRIATAAMTLSSRDAVRDTAAVLLSKLSNFRAIALATHRNLLVEGLEGRLGMTLRIEAQRRQMDQSVLIQSSGRWLPVNEFQQRFWTSAGDPGWLSASAPTASGKTYVVLLWLLDQMRSTDAKVAVYLAPTRALVSEIEASLQLLIGKSPDIDVSSLPLRAKYDAALGDGAKLILVFTQERLHLIANVIGDAIKIDLLIVDEAHKIGDNQRGVILQDAIERVSRVNPALKLVFISPATENPEELLLDAPDGVQVAAIESDAPTVLQNLIVAEQVPRTPKRWALSVRGHGASLPIGVLVLANSPAGLKKRLAFIAAAVGERGGTLVYANGAAEAEDVADLISQLQPPPDKLDTELAALAALAREGVHPQFRLAPLVERGVAFHYGNMPSLIRLEIERLFRSGKLRFLVCTSTLIEGVNLSCRTIVLRGPRKGMGHPMEAHDFWNLAGRAGRWGDEFQGNIICIDPYDTFAWPGGVPSRARYPIKRESDAVIELGDGLADYLDRRANTDLASIGDAERFEQVGAYLLATYLRVGSIAQANLAKRHDPAVVSRLDESLAAIAAKIEIEPDLVGRHPGVSAFGLQNLLDAFRRYEGDIENLLPAAVDSQDSYDRFVTIMRRINENLFPAFVPQGRVRLHALIVVQWLRGHSLARIIRENIDYHLEVKRSYKLPVLIRDTMDLVEQIARFRAPKYLSAYVDVLHLHLRETGRPDLIEDELDIGTQLEFGVSSRTLLSLMELGLSRMSAVALYEKISRDDLSQQDCIAWVAERKAQFEGMGIPAIILHEILAKLMPADPEFQVSPP